MQWLIMQAPDVPWGSVTNISKIDNVRLIPKLDEDGKATGEVQVHISTEMSQQAFTYPDLPTAQEEYFRISNEIRGTVPAQTQAGLGGLLDRERQT